METGVGEFRRALEAYAADFGIVLDPEHLNRLTDYYQLMLNWNQRLHLVAPCSPGEFAIRHVLESLLMLKHLPGGATVVDVGSGAGLPIVPCLLIRGDLRATLIESSKRKAVFLREALRAVQPEGRSEVIARRFEEIDSPQPQFVSSRALDRFSTLLPALMSWAGPQAEFLFFCGDELRVKLDSLLSRPEIERIPHSQSRFLVSGYCKGASF